MEFTLAGPEGIVGPVHVPHAFTKFTGQKSTGIHAANQHSRRDYDLKDYAQKSMEEGQYVALISLDVRGRSILPRGLEYYSH